MSFADTARDADTYAKFEAEIKRLRDALERIVDSLGYAKNEGKSLAVRESNAHEAWKIARAALKEIEP